MARKPKYKPSYAKQLRDGLRLQPRRVSPSGVIHGWTIEWICVEWGISKTTYYNWVKEYTTFAEAHDIGELHFKAFLQEEFDEAIFNKDCNGQLMKLKAAKFLNYTDKKQVEHKHENNVQRIEVEIIPKREALEIQPTNVIDIVPEHEKNKT